MAWVKQVAKGEGAAFTCRMEKGRVGHGSRQVAFWACWEQTDRPGCRPFGPLYSGLGLFDPRK